MTHDDWTFIMNEAQSKFLGEVTVPRISVTRALSAWARNPTVQQMEAKGGGTPYIFVQPPRFSNGDEARAFHGWFVLEWAFTTDKDEVVRLRVYTSFNPAVKHPLYAFIDETFTPSQASYFTRMGHYEFLDVCEDMLNAYGPLEQRDPRMKSRHDIPKNLAGEGLIPLKGQILDEGHKLSCHLMKTVYETLPSVKDEDLEEFIRLSDETLSPVYMPMSPNVTFVSNILT